MNRRSRGIGSLLRDRLFLLLFRNRRFSGLFRSCAVRIERPSVPGLSLVFLACQYRTVFLRILVFLIPGLFGIFYLRIVRTQPVIVGLLSIRSGFQCVVSVQSVCSGLQCVVSVQTVCSGLQCVVSVQTVCSGLQCVVRVRLIIHSLLQNRVRICAVVLSLIRDHTRIHLIFRGFFQNRVRICAAVPGLVQDHARIHLIFRGFLQNPVRICAAVLSLVLDHARIHLIFSGFLQTRVRTCLFVPVHPLSIRIRICLILQSIVKKGLPGSFLIVLL